MFEAQLPGVSNDMCQACMGTRGTIYHRCCCCPATADLREHSKHQGILSIAQSAVQCQDSLFQHGVPHLKPLPPPPPFVERWCGGVEIEDFVVQGSVFTDGSLTGGAQAGTERAGWAVVVVDDSGQVTGGIYGTCPDHFLLK